MRFTLCEKQFLYLNTDADAVNAEMSMRRFPSGQHGLLHNSFFQHDSELNKTMKLVTQYSGSTNLTYYASLTPLIQFRNREEVTGKN